MILRSRLALIAISAALILLLLLALLHAPPDGRERGDFSQFVGRFHPLVVHLPIALLLLVPLLECFGSSTAGVIYVSRLVLFSHSHRLARSSRFF